MNRYLLEIGTAIEHIAELIINPGERITIRRAKEDMPKFVFQGVGGSEYSLYLAGGRISREHARFDSAAFSHSLSFTDLGSTNGSFICGQSCPANLPVKAEDGDVFRIASDYNIVVKRIKERLERPAPTPA